MKPDEREYIAAMLRLPERTVPINYYMAMSRCGCEQCGGSGVMHHKRAEALHQKWIRKGYIEVINSKYGEDFTREGLAWIAQMGINATDDSST